jgi:hypothetical protein
MLFGADASGALYFGDAGGAGLEVWKADVGTL